MKKPASDYRHGVPPSILLRLERILAHGAAKHGEPKTVDHPCSDSDVHGEVAARMLAGVYRHLDSAGSRGDYGDLETCELHVLHAAARLILLACHVHQVACRPCDVTQEPRA